MRLVDLAADPLFAPVRPVVFEPDGRFAAELDERDAADRVDEALRLVAPERPAPDFADDERGAVAPERAPVERDEVERPVVEREAVDRAEVVDLRAPVVRADVPDERAAVERPVVPARRVVPERAEPDLAAVDPRAVDFLLGDADLAPVPVERDFVVLARLDVVRDRVPEPVVFFFVESVAVVRFLGNFYPLVGACS